MQQTLSPKELLRLHDMSHFERRCRAEGYVRIGGVDEAGRGPLAGPVVAAACILPEGTLFEHLNDSKQLDPQKRDALFSQITTDPGIEFGLGIVDAPTIDQINILQATFLAMKQAIQSLKQAPDILLIDGNRAPSLSLPFQAIVKGDSKSISIAAASILAKVTRDRMMEAFAKEWPEYGFEEHKGYGTERHRQALEKYGPCPIHRRSFAPIKQQLDLPLF
jgi:ribonuclease HII